MKTTYWYETVMDIVNIAYIHCKLYTNTLFLYNTLVLIALPTPFIAV